MLRQSFSPLNPANAELLDSATLCVYAVGLCTILAHFTYLFFYPPSVFSVFTLLWYLGALVGLRLFLSTASSADYFDWRPRQFLAGGANCLIDGVYDTSTMVAAYFNDRSDGPAEVAAMGLVDWTQKIARKARVEVYEVAYRDEANSNSEALKYRLTGCSQMPDSLKMLFDGQQACEARRY